MRKRQEWLICAAVIVSLATGGINARGQATFGVLHSFTNSTSDGSTPVGQPVLIGSTLYGVTLDGGSSSDGTLYNISTNGTGFGVLYSFTGGANGANPFCTLVSTGASFYGMTYNGGVNDGGVVFGVNTNGTGYSVLHTFLGGAGDGQYPFGSLTLNGTNLYGMTGGGGSNDDGVVFSVSTAGKNFTVFHSFAGGTNDGAFPNEGVIVSGSTLYGTAYYGGSNDLGIVFAVNTAVNSNAFSILHQFAGGTNDGANPAGPLALSGSSLYGLATAGGTNDLGVIFKVSTNGSGYAVLHSFTGEPNDGAYPQFGPLVVTNSVIYGATEEGGTLDSGVLFQMNTDGTGFTVAHGFSGGTNDGAYPAFGPLVSGSIFYGVTPNGGSNDLGVVYGAPPTNTATTWQVCTNVPGTTSAGVAITNVVAGQAYMYTASGAVAFNTTGCFSDPDGEMVAGNCLPFIADSGFPCTGLQAESLVGEINGGGCFQMGSSGYFVASESGTLTLIFNDDNYGDNSGSFTVCITPATSMCTTVLATDEAPGSGAVVGNVVAGQMYLCTASGECHYNYGVCQANPDGFLTDGGMPNTSVCNPILGDTTFTCPGIQAFSLVGNINGGACIPLGASMYFVAPSTGPLMLYFNDDWYGDGDNSGSWSACITPVSCPGTNFLTQISAIWFVGVNVVITIPTVTCQTYQLQYSDAMVPTNWSNVFGAVAAGTGNPIHLIDFRGVPVTTCLSVSATAPGGVVYGNVIAGEVYGYQASGCAQAGATAWDDPNGNEYANSNCSGSTHTFVADDTFVCSGVTAHMLVGKVNGICVPMGSDGSFTAPASGTLTLYFNDNIWDDNSGSWDVCITAPWERFYRVAISP